MTPGVPAGVNPRWSVRVEIPDADGTPLEVHALDSWAGREGEPELTLLCVHGNPTWSFLWRRLLAEAPSTWRVVAIDHIGMGLSTRPELHRGHPTTHLAYFSSPHPRRLAERVDDLDRMSQALGITGPVITVAHDWGGPISLGWALRHRDHLVGVVLANTAVAQPPGSPAPALIRTMRLPGVLDTMTVRSQGFLRGALRLGPAPLPDEVRAGFLAPYPNAKSRAAIGDFVADIPLDPAHPSYAALTGIAEGVRTLDVPVLLLWGPADPVFSDLYLHDLIERMPHADVQRYPGAGHLVTEDAPAAIPDLIRWVGETIGRGSDGARAEADAPVTAFADVPSASAPTLSLSVELPPAVTPRRDLGAALRERRDDYSVAVAEPGRTVTWQDLAARVDALAAGLLAAGVESGDRVGLLVPPGADLAACAYACWRIGAVIVAADAGLGARGMSRALTGAGPQHVIAVPKGLALLKAMRVPVPGLRILVGTRTAAARPLGADHLLADLIPMGAAADLPPPPAPDAEAAVVFTSGATGPSKGVVYRHAALEAQRDALTSLYGITRDDALVAAFGPWSVLGPALGIASAVPDVPPTKPGSLTARALADAALAVDARLVWASPAALRSVLATADDLNPGQRAALTRVRLLMSAGAPVPAQLLRDSRRLMPAAEAHTPYGMTEVLPVADIDLDGLQEAGEGNGVCVGRPVPGVDVRIDPLAADGSTTGDLTAAADLSGEIVVLAPHAKDRYDRLWAVEEATHLPGGGHRTGDVGHLDAQGRLWVEGRLAHVITTDRGPLTPVGIEHAVEAQVACAAAAVGVGPRGTQQVVVVLACPGRGPLAPLDLVDRVREAAPDAQVAAVLRVDALPVDTRHNAKVDRAALAEWAAGVLAGHA